MILSKSRDLCLPAFAVERPDAIQFVLVNSAALGCLQLLDPMHKFPHRSDKWFGKFCPASRLSVRIHSRGLRSVTREDHGYGKDECLSLQMLRLSLRRFQNDLPRPWLLLRRS